MPFSPSTGISASSSYAAVTCASTCGKLRAKRILIVERQHHERNGLALHPLQRQLLIGVGVVEALHERDVPAGKSATREDEHVGYGPETSRRSVGAVQRFR